MNIAFTTVLLFIILAPGFLARNAYASSKLSVHNPNKNIINELTWAIIPSLTIHIIFISFIHSFTKYYVDFEQLGNLILGVTNNDKVDVSFKQLGIYKYPIFFYNLSIFVASIIAGYLFRLSVRKCKLDRRIRYLRFSNKWHYIFSGECLDFPDVPDEYVDITHKIVNVLCKVNGRSILYTGEIFNYYIDNNGDLEAIHLKYPIRRYLESDNSLDGTKYYEIESRYLVIPNSDIININFRYFNLKEVNETELSATEIDNAIKLDET